MSVTRRTLLPSTKATGGAPCRRKRGWHAIGSGPSSGPGPWAGARWPGCAGSSGIEDPVLPVGAGLPGLRQRRPPAPPLASGGSASPPASSGGRPPKPGPWPRWAWPGSGPGGRSGRPREPGGSRPASPGSSSAWARSTGASWKGVGRLWQAAAVDAATPCAWARVVVHDKTARQAAAFLEEVVLPAFREEGHRVRAALTEGDPEFVGPAFREALARAGIAHRRTRPRRPQAGGICERFHGTVLHEPTRRAFRRRYYRSAAEVQGDLDGFLRYYNFEREHFGRGMAPPRGPRGRPHGVPRPGRRRPEARPSRTPAGRRRGDRSA
jgi:transposase InsO family protein